MGELRRSSVVPGHVPRPRGGDPRRARRDEGFTLLELLISLAIMPLIVGAIGLAAITSLNSQSAATIRFADTHDAQETGAYFFRDVQTATSVSTSTTATQCPLSGGVAQVLGLSWVVTGSTDYVSYGISTGTKDPYLIRRFCRGSAPAVTTYLATGVFLGLASPTLSNSCPGSASSCATSSARTDVVVTVNCQDGTTTCADANWVPTFPSGTAPGIGSVTLTVTEHDPVGCGTAGSVPCYSYTLTASPRTEFMGTANPPGSVGPAVLLLGSSGTGSLLTCGGSSKATVTVDGTAAIDSSSAGSVSLGSNVSFSASEVLSQDPSTGSGGPVQGGNPPYSGPEINSPYIPDPYQTLPEPSTAGMTVYTSTPSPLAPGVYTSAVSVTTSESIPPGIYVFERGLSLSGNGALSGHGVMFFFGVPNGTVSQQTATPLSISGNGGINITAATTGTYAGVALFEARTDSNTLAISGNGSSSTYGGVIYAPSASVSAGGNGGAGAGEIVSSSMACAGNGGFAVGFAVVSTAPSSNTVLLGSPNTDTVQVVGSPDRGAPAGTVSFTVCPSSTPPTCSSGPVAVGTAVTVAQGANDISTGTSAPLTPKSVGSWCFQGTFSSSDGNYGTSGDSSISECFVVVGPSLSITFPADGATYSRSSGKTAWSRQDPCSSNTLICGSASDTNPGSSLTPEQFTLEAPNGLCWDGTLTGGVANFTANCATAWRAVGTPGSSWSQVFAQSYFSSGPAYAGTYVLSVRETDSNSLTTTVTSTFTMN